MVYFSRKRRRRGGFRSRKRFRRSMRYSLRPLGIRPSYIGRSGLRPEIKNYDCPGDQTHTGYLPLIPTIATFSAYMLPRIPQGSANGQRVGMQLSVKSLLLKMYFNPDHNSTIVDSVSRFCVVIDRQANGIDLAAAGAFGTAVMANDHVWGLPNVDTKRRFKILRDKTITMPGVTSATTTCGAYGKFYKVYIRFRKPLVIQFSGTGGTAGDVVTNNIWVAFVGYPTPGNDVFFTWRIKYGDM